MKKTRLYFLLTALLFAGSAMAATYFYSPYSSPKNHTAFLVNLADPTNEDDRIALTGANCTNGSRAITSNPTSIVDGVSKITADSNKKLYYIKFDSKNPSFTFSIAKKSNFSVVFTSPNTGGSLVLSSIASDKTETAIETVAANSALAIFTLSKELEAGSYKLAYSIKEMDIFEILLVEAASTDDATLKSITVNGEKVKGFAPETTTYNVELPFGTTDIPDVAATATSSKARVSITQAAAVDGTATIVVTAEDGIATQTYTVKFTVAESQSEDATLASISIDGTAIADFKADSLDYTHTIAYAAKAIPEVTAVVHDETANIDITQADAVPGKATIVVTAQAGNTQTYTVTISRAAAIKHLTVVPFTNGAKGAINETALTVTAPYMIDEDVPTVDGEHIAVSSDGTPTATLSEDGATITLKGDDDVEAVYTVVTTALTPDTLTADEKTFTGKETYIFAPYGWASDKGWKFAKKVNDEGNMRDAKGNTRIYMALPPAESVKLTSGSGGARSVVIYVNGAKSDIDETAAKNEAITLALNSTTNNFVAIECGDENANGGGDGGFTKIQLVNPRNPIGSAVEQAQVAVKAVKVIRDGQLLIIREGKTYTAQGVQVQ